MPVPSTEPPVWIEPVRIGSFDVDATRRATGTGLCRYFLEAAWNHAEALGVGFNHLRAQGKFWVLARLRLEVKQYPIWGSKVVLRTWPRGVESVFAMREFTMEEEQGQLLAAGSSAWLVLDMISKRPQRLAKILPSLAILEGKDALSQNPSKLAPNETWDGAFTALVRYTDIDVNQHVNSSRYIGWILDAYPAGFHSKHSLDSLEINYLGETLQGDELIIRSRHTGGATYCHSLSKANGPEVCRAVLAWGATAGQG
jgi:medium-chain acyl-[acyl-carrier-protein] hydrolase